MMELVKLQAAFHTAKAALVQGDFVAVRAAIAGCSSQELQLLSSCLRVPVSVLRRIQADSKA